ncbi:spore germination protein [Ectobacillus funiculus]
MLLINIQKCKKINSMASNASINIGPAFHNSHSAHSKFFLGNSTSVGDTSPIHANMDLNVQDPDFVDQSDIGTTESPIVEQQQNT